MPDSGQHHDIEADRQRTDDAQFRKLVVDPADARVGVKAAGAIDDFTSHLMVTDPPYGVNYDPATGAARANSKGR
jgi:hypothetical protein